MKAKKGKMTQFSTKLYRPENCTLTIIKAHLIKKVLLLSAKHIFYNSLDLAAINAWILYKETTQVHISRKDLRIG